MTYAITPYIDVTWADDYFTAMGVTTWAGSDELKEAAINRAYQYLRYLNWIEQPDEDDPDEEVMQANAEAALVELVTPGALSTSSDRGSVLQETITGVLSVTYSDSGSSKTDYAAIMNPIKNLIVGGVNRKVLL
jgi:hypothetical protein